MGNNQSAKERMESSSDKCSTSGMQKALDAGLDINAHVGIDGPAICHVCGANKSFKKRLAGAAWLAEKGADLSAGGFRGRTPLHYACGKKDVELVKFLIEKGADPSKGDLKGVTALHELALLVGSENQFLQIELAEALLEGGANPDAVETEEGGTPLRNAIRAGNFEMVKCLVQHGADVNAKDKEGKSLFYHAAWMGQENAVRWLVSKPERATKNSFWDATGYLREDDRRRPLLKIFEDAFAKQQAWEREHGASNEASANAGASSSDDVKVVSEQDDEEQEETEET